MLLGIFGCLYMDAMFGCAKCDYVQNVQNMKNYTNTKNYIVSVIIKCAKCLNIYVWLFYDTDSVRYDWKKKSLITFCIFSDDINNVNFFYNFYY